MFHVGDWLLMQLNGFGGFLVSASELSKVVQVITEHSMLNKKEKERSFIWFCDIFADITGFSLKTSM